jgi:PAS domain S-box-containing protein
MSGQEDKEDLKAEVARLRARVAELEQRVALKELPAGETAATGPDIPYKAIVDSMPVSVVVYNENGDPIDLNEATCARYGVPRERAITSFNILTEPALIELGFDVAFRRALAGEIQVMPPGPYDRPESPLNPGSRPRLWNQSIYFSVKHPTGARYVIELNFDVTALKEAEAKERQSAALLEAIVENAPLLIYARDKEGRPTLMNRKSAALFGHSVGGEPPETTSQGQMPSDVADAWRAHDMEVMAAGALASVENAVALADGWHVFLSHKFALRGEGEEVVGVCGMTLDITERVRTEERNKRLQEEMLRAREETLRSISTPLMPIADGVLVVPLVGEMTRERAEQLIETLLSGVASQRARLTILDMTGMPQTGPDVIDALLRAARGVRLLGAEIILTGIRPSVAQALVELSADLGSIVTQATLERGVAYALRTRREDSSGATPRGR